MYQAYLVRFNLDVYFEQVQGWGASLPHALKVLILKTHSTFCLFLVLNFEYSNAIAFMYTLCVLFFTNENYSFVKVHCGQVRITQCHLISLSTWNSITNRILPNFHFICIILNSCIIQRFYSLYIKKFTSPTTFGYTFSNNKKCVI